MLGEKGPTQGRSVQQVLVDVTKNNIGSGSINTDIPLRVKPAVAEQMLNFKLYADADVGDVLELAKIATKGRILVRDKAAAIAVLVGQRELEMRCPEWIKDRQIRQQLRALFAK